uniref:Uncharacterized protein n=1 Tax=Populus trichocarpa TaxID=3694 RepID=A0A2K2AZJ5_POPTR
MRLSSNGLSNDQKKELAIFANWILAIGDGTQHDALFPDDSDASMIKIPQDLLLEPGSNPILAIVSALYPSIRDINIDPCYFRERAIVTPRNATVSEINDFILNMLPGMKRIYLSTDTVCKTSSDGDNAEILYPVEFINQLEFNGVPSHTISLRIGTPIMLLRNLNLSAGLCNGTSLIVTQLAERVIEAQIITGTMALPIKQIKKYNFYPSLRARACRVWIAKFNGQPSNFNCVFVDNQFERFYDAFTANYTNSPWKSQLQFHTRATVYQGGVIQALAKTRDLLTFAATIIEGNHYEIKGFYTYENRVVNTVTVHDAVIDLKSNTKITGIEAITPHVPRYYFNFIDYAHILTKSKGSRILTDVLGRLKALQPLEQVMVCGQTLENKREFMLENIRGEELHITLWGDSARDFDELALHNLPSPVIIAFTGFRVTEFKGKPNLNSTTTSLWYFNPDIPECLAYKHFFAQLPVEIQQLPSSSNVVYR